MLRGQEGVTASRPSIPGLTPEQVDAMMKLSKLKQFKEIKNEVQSNPDFEAWVQSTAAEQNVPQLWADDPNLGQYLSFLRDD